MSLVKSSSVSVGVAATAFATSDAPRVRRVHLTNVGAATVYLGGSGVTTAQGFPLVANATLQLILDLDALFGIVTTGTVDVRVMEVFP